MKRFLPLLLAGFILIACSKTDEEAIYRKNTAYGVAVTFNEFGLRDSLNRVKVELKSGNVTFETVSDDSGQWEIPDVPTGTYSILLSREGYIDAETWGRQWLMWERTNAGYFFVIKKFDHQLDYFHYDPADPGRVYLSFADDGWPAGGIMSYYININTSFRDIESDSTIEHYYGRIYNTESGNYQSFTCNSTDTVFCGLPDLSRYFSAGAKVEMTLRASEDNSNSVRDIYKSQDGEILINKSDVLATDTITVL